MKWEALRVLSRGGVQSDLSLTRNSGKAERSRLEEIVVDTGCQEGEYSVKPGERGWTLD